MRALAIPTLLLFMLSAQFSAQAADIKVLAPGLLGTGIVTLAERWGAETGNKVIFPAPNATVGRLEKMVQSDEAYDVLLLPPDALAAFAGKLKPGSEKPVGRVVFGLAVKEGSPHPDISTPAKFRAALMGKTVAYNDPATGSIAGIMVDALFKQPDYAGVKAMAHHNPAVSGVIAGDTEMAVAVEGEEVGAKGIEIVGPVPDGAGLRLDVSGAVLANAPEPDAAAAFLAYITRPEAASVWLPTGIAMIRP
jgi:molybdate transport system substrate-binding protein